MDSEPEIGGSAWGSSRAITSGVWNGEPAEPANACDMSDCEVVDGANNNDKQKGVDFVLEVAKAELQVKRERIEVAETRATVAEQKLAAVEKEKEKAGLAAKVANKKAAAAKRKEAAAVQERESAVREKEIALEHVACRICEVVKDEKYVMITCGHMICFDCFYKGEEVRNRDDPNKCPFCRRVLRKESKKLKRVYL
ncbi:hypothetical protein ACHAXT_010476 [Thalassiosira profunda]